MATKEISKGPRVRNIRPVNVLHGNRVLRDPDPLRLELFQLLRRLQLTAAVVTAAVGALKAQGAERDEDIALVLQRHVGDALAKEAEKWEGLLEFLKKDPRYRKHYKES